MASRTRRTASSRAPSVQVPHQGRDRQALATEQADLRFSDVDRELFQALVSPVELDVRHAPLVPPRDEVVAVDVAAPRGQAAGQRTEDLDRKIAEPEADEVRRVMLEQVLERLVERLHQPSRYRRRAGPASAGRPCGVLWSGPLG